MERLTASNHIILQKSTTNKKKMAKIIIKSSHWSSAVSLSVLLFRNVTVTQYKQVQKSFGCFLEVKNIRKCHKKQNICI